jgi:hypothetical protein
MPKKIYGNKSTIKKKTFTNKSTVKKKVKKSGPSQTTSRKANGGPRKLRP